MNFEQVQQAILTDFYTRYTSTPYRVNGNELAVDPSASYAGKNLDQVNDFVDFAIFQASASRRLLNALTKGRWVSGFIRVNAYDKKVSGDTKVNSVRVYELLGIIDGLYSEKTVSDTNVEVVFETASQMTSAGMNDVYQRFEGVMRIPFTARFK